MSVWVTFQLHLMSTTHTASSIESAQQFQQDSFSLQRKRRDPALDSFQVLDLVQESSLVGVLSHLCLLYVIPFISSGLFLQRFLFRVSPFPSIFPETYDTCRERRRER
jgi:hypothetical protein